MKNLCYALFLISLSLFNMESTPEENNEKQILSLCRIPIEVLDKNLLPYLLGSIETQEEFRVRIENAAQQKDGWHKDDSNPGFKGLLPKNKFAIDYVMASENNSYLGIYQKNASQHTDKIKIVERESSRNLYTFELEKPDFIGMAVSNYGNHIALCFLNKQNKSFDLVWRNLITHEKKDFPSIPLENSILYNCKPLLFYNSQETLIGLLLPSSPSVINYPGIPFQVRPAKTTPDNIRIVSIMDSEIFSKSLEEMEPKKRQKITTLLDLFKSVKIIDNNLEEKQSLRPEKIKE